MELTPWGTVRGRRGKPSRAERVSRETCTTHPDFTQELPRKLRELLDDPCSPDWPSAVRILKARIHERFIDPVDHLIAAEQAKPIMERRFGFTILAVDCLLVETLGAFIEGLTDTEGKSRATFCGFLTTRPLFKEESTPDRATRFYYDFRCGILHQAEIGGDSKVWSIGPLLQDNGSRIIINRTKFHELLKAEFRSYLAAESDRLRPSGSTRRPHPMRIDTIINAARRCLTIVDDFRPVRLETKVRRPITRSPRPPAAAAIVGS